MTDNPGGYPPPPPGGYPPPPGGEPTPQGGYQPPPPPGGYPPPPQGNYPPGGFPPQQPGGYPQAAPALPKDAYTSWLTRVAAWFIDYIPVFILVGIGQGIAILTGDNNCESINGGYACTSEPSALGATVSILASLLSIAYVVWNYGYRQGTTGSSIGKSVMKFKVVSEKTYQPIGFGLSVVRQIAHIVDGIICYIGYLFPLWDAKRQTLADKIMTTVCLPATPQGQHGQQPTHHY